MHKERYILLSFDVEEFDMPLEYGQPLTMMEQLRVGGEGLKALMDVVNRFPLQATFFTTANFAIQFPDDIKQISLKHEIASHTYYHSTYWPADLAASKMALEKITGKPVSGLRLPRMRPVEMKDVVQAGYRYDSSINPTFLPGRYNNLGKPRNPYMEEGMLRFPVSVSPNLRIPLFWLSFKNFPYLIYRNLVKRALDRDGYVCLYFHPWEFIPLTQYKIPGYAKRLAGAPLQERLSRLITDLLQWGSFLTMEDYIGLRGKVLVEKNLQTASS